MVVFSKFGGAMLVQFVITDIDALKMVETSAAAAAAAAVGISAAVPNALQGFGAAGTALLQYDEEHQPELPDCPICCYPIEWPALLITDCKHLFHCGCFLVLLQYTNRCPMCRRECRPQNPVPNLRLHVPFWTTTRRVYGFVVFVHFFMAIWVLCFDGVDEFKKFCMGLGVCYLFGIFFYLAITYCECEEEE